MIVTKNVETKLTVSQNVRTKKKKGKKRHGITFIIMMLFHKIIRPWLFMYLETLKKRKAKEKKEFIVYKKFLQYLYILF